MSKNGQACAHLAVWQHHWHHGHAGCACCYTAIAIVATSAVVLEASAISRVCLLPVALIIPSIAAAPLVIPSIPTSLQPTQNPSTQEQGVCVSLVECVTFSKQGTASSQAGNGTAGV